MKITFQNVYQKWDSHIDKIAKIVQIKKVLMKDRRIREKRSTLKSLKVPKGLGSSSVCFFLS